MRGSLPFFVLQQPGIIRQDHPVIAAATSPLGPAPLKKLGVVFAVVATLLQPGEMILVRWQTDKSIFFLSFFSGIAQQVRKAIIN